MVSRTKQAFGPEVSMESQSGIRTVYRVGYEDGEGTMTVLSLFPGVDLILNDFSTFHCFQSTSPQPGMMEINHCRRGRFECEFRRGTYAYMGEGDLSVNMLENAASGNCFPLKMYQGVSVFMDLWVAEKYFEAQLSGFQIHLDGLREKLCPENRCFVLKSPERIQRIFDEIYRADWEIQAGYLRLKTLELLSLLADLPSSPYETVPYYDANQVRKVKHIRDHLTRSLEKNITLAQLAREHKISLTGLKNCFKSIYGKGASAYRREYRIQTAAELLRDRALTVAEIAGRVGYENPSKFSSAFKEIMGMSPSEYRNK